jgi:hypothetical protein
MAEGGAKLVASRDDLKVGDIVFQTLDRNDGLTLTSDHATRNKYFVIVGKNSKGDAIGLCLVNSNLDFYKDVPEMQKFQYILKQADYPAVLTKDSRLDCAVLFPMKARKSVAVKARVVGHLTETDEKVVLPLVASCGFIDEHVRKVFRLNTYLQP